MAKKPDYSKWDHIEISDDEYDIYTNIDIASLFRWRHQARIKRMEKEKEKKEAPAKEGGDSSTESNKALEKQSSQPPDDPLVKEKSPEVEERTNSEALREKEKEIQELRMMLEDTQYKLVVLESKLSLESKLRHEKEVEITYLEETVEDLQLEISALNERAKYQQEQIAELKGQRQGIYETSGDPAAVPHPSHTRQQAHFAAVAYMYPHSGMGSELVASSAHVPSLVARDAGEPHSSPPIAAIQRPTTPEPPRSISMYPTTQSRYIPVPPSGEFSQHPIHGTPSVHPGVSHGMSHGVSHGMSHGVSHGAYPESRLPKAPPYGATFNPVPPTTSAYLPPVTVYAGTDSVTSDSPLETSEVPTAGLHSSHSLRLAHFSTASYTSYPHSRMGYESRTPIPTLVTHGTGEPHSSTWIERSTSPQPPRMISMYPTTRSRYTPVLPSGESSQHPVLKTSPVPVVNPVVSHGLSHGVSHGAYPDFQLPKTPLYGATFQYLPPTTSAYLPPVTVQAGTDSVTYDPSLKHVHVQTEEIPPVDLTLPESVDHLQQDHSSMKPSPSAFDYLRGVDVIAETQFVLTKGAQSFEWEEYGFKLHAPKGSLPEGLDQCDVKVKVSLSGQFDLPENSELVSAVYWVYSPHLFLEPLTVEIQHCAAITTPTQCAQLTFIRTKCTQKELPYSFKELDGGSFKPNTPYGSISVTHFSGIGVAKKSIKASSSRKRVVHAGQETCSQSSSRGTSREDDVDVQVQYCGQLYIFKRINDWRVHFVVTKDLKVCLKVVGEHYSAFTSEDLSLSIGFESDKICLDVPEDGARLKDNWKIYPRYDPTVKKSDVDLFTSGKRIPKCEMILEWENESVPPKRMRHKVGLQGARDHKFFLLVVDPDDEVSNKGTQPSKTGLPSQSSSIEHTCLQNEPELRHFQNLVACKIPRKWQEVGIQLGLEEGELRAFAESAGGDHMRCFTSVFTAWRNQQTRDFSWETVVSVLRTRAVAEIRLADEVSSILASHQS